MTERFKSLPTKGATAVDREARIIRGVSLAQQGEALGHKVDFDQKTIAAIVEKGNAKKAGVKVRFTHPGLSSDGMGKFLGRVKDLRMDGDKAKGDLHLAESASSSPYGDLAEYVMDLAEEDPDAFGMSVAVRKVKHAWIDAATGAEVEHKPLNSQQKRPYLRFEELSAADVVDEPAANRDGLFSSSLWGSNQTAEAAFIELDAMLARHGVDQVKAWEVAQKYFNARGVDIQKGSSNLMEQETTTPADAGQPGRTGTPDAAAVNPWAVALQNSARDAMLSASGLPKAAQEKLRKQTFANPDGLADAIEDERTYLSTFAQSSAVKGMTPIITAKDMITQRDYFQNAWDWMFGAPVEMPKPHMRNLAGLYVAMTGDSNFWGVFNPEEAQFAEATTGTMAGMAVNALNKVINAHYDNMMTYRWFEQIVDVVPHDGSTHDIHMIYVDGLGNLPTVAEGAAYVEATPGDSRETMAFSKRGRYVGITLEMIRRSDIVRMRAIPKNLVLAGVRTRSAAVAGIFTQASGVGPTMADDATALFHNNHGNLMTTAFSAAAWATMRQRIWEQVVPGAANPLAMWPKYCLVPIELFDTAMVAFGWGAGADMVGRPNSAGTAQEGNIYGESRPGDPRPIPVPVPEWTDANDWAAITDPRLHAPICMAYAAAPGGGQHPMPEIYTVTSETSGLMFSNDTMPVKVRDWFGVGVATHVGVGKSNV